MANGSTNYNFNIAPYSYLLTNKDRIFQKSDLVDGINKIAYYTSTDVGDYNATIFELNVQDDNVTILEKTRYSQKRGLKHNTLKNVNFLNMCEDNNIKVLLHSLMLSPEYDTEEENYKYIMVKKGRSFYNLYGKDRKVPHIHVPRYENLYMIKINYNNFDNVYNVKNISTFELWLDANNFKVNLKSNEKQDVSDNDFDMEKALLFINGNKDEKNKKSTKNKKNIKRKNKNDNEIFEWWNDC